MCIRDSASLVPVIMPPEVLLPACAALRFSHGVGSASSSKGIIICCGTDTNKDLDVHGSATISPLKLGSYFKNFSTEVHPQKCVKYSSTSSCLLPAPSKKSI